MSRTTITIDQFVVLMRAAGHDEVVERAWAPGTVVDTHTHPFDVNALIVAGELTLTLADLRTRCCARCSGRHERARASSGVALP
jgi:hypothetical protein